MTELDEIAAKLLPDAREAGLRYERSDTVRAWLRERLPDETPEVIDGVLWALWNALSVEH